jgi:hypothetical protein
MSSKKILLENLRTLVENTIKEMDLKTYATVMNKTENYPWIRMLSKDKNGKKEERVNKLAKNRFIDEFFKKFPRKSESTNILTNDGEYNFGGVHFNTNYTNYSVYFIKVGDDGWSSHLWIRPERNGYYVDDKTIEITDEKSDKIINDMLKYNSVKN